MSHSEHIARNLDEGARVRHSIRVIEQRVRQMIAGAKHLKKLAPTPEWLYGMARLQSDKRGRVLCGNPGCRTVLAWTKAESWDRALSLQHDNDGRLRLLCMRCNVEHKSIGDDIYKWPAGKRPCKMCGALYGYIEARSLHSAYSCTCGPRWCQKCHDDHHENLFYKMKDSRHIDTVRGAIRSALGDERMWKLAIECREGKSYDKIFAERMRKSEVRI